jgi:hypothetical protein
MEEIYNHQFHYSIFAIGDSQFYCSEMVQINSFAASPQAAGYF